MTREYGCPSGYRKIGSRCLLEPTHLVTFTIDVEVNAESCDEAVDKAYEDIPNGSINLSDCKKVE